MVFKPGNGKKHAVPKANTNAYDALQSGEGRGASNLKKGAPIPTPDGYGCSVLLVLSEEDCVCCTTSKA